MSEVKSTNCICLEVLVFDIERIYVTKMKYFGLLLLLLPQLIGAQIKQMNTSNLENQLIELGYQQLFQYGERSKAYDIWQKGTKRTALQNLIVSSETSLYGKFLAAEVLRYFKIALHPTYHETLAEAYTHALACTSVDKEEKLILTGNLWGLLYESNDSGYLGKQLIAFGKSATPYLIKLLDNDNGRILYEGSREATIGNSYQYRVNDFAAFYLSKITDTLIRFYKDLAARDAEIERFKKGLKKK